MRATITNTLRHSHKNTRDFVLDTMNQIKDRQALAIRQEIREARLCHNEDGFILL